MGSRTPLILLLSYALFVAADLPSCTRARCSHCQVQFIAQMCPQACAQCPPLRSVDDDTVRFLPCRDFANACTRPYRATVGDKARRLLAEALRVRAGTLWRLRNPRERLTEGRRQSAYRSCKPVRNSCSNSHNNRLQYLSSSARREVSQMCNHQPRSRSSTNLPALGSRHNRNNRRTRK